MRREILNSSSFIRNPPSHPHKLQPQSVLLLYKPEPSLPGLPSPPTPLRQWRSHEAHQNTRRACEGYRISDLLALGFNASRIRSFKSSPGDSTAQPGLGTMENAISQYSCNLQYVHIRTEDRPCVVVISPS